MKFVSEENIKIRLQSKLASDQIEELINQYIEADNQFIPDVGALTALQRKSTPSDSLRVSFRLPDEMYQALCSHFAETAPASTLVQKALSAFIEALP